MGFKMTDVYRELMRGSPRHKLTIRYFQDAFGFDCVLIGTTDGPRRHDRGMLLVIAILLLLLWGGGFAFHVAGALIHILLLIALVVFILHFVLGRRTV
jgi:Family of unknown function (DUF5670)